MTEKSKKIVDLLSLAAFGYLLGLFFWGLLQPNGIPMYAPDGKKLFGFKLVLTAIVDFPFAAFGGIWLTVRHGDKFFNKHPELRTGSGRAKLMILSGLTVIIIQLLGAFFRR